MQVHAVSSASVRQVGYNLSWCDDHRNTDASITLSIPFWKEMTTRKRWKIL